MKDIKLAEINITNILIVFFVGTGGILSIWANYEQGAALCFGGLVGYMGRYVTDNSITNTSKNEVDDIDKSKDTQVTTSSEEGEYA